MSAWKNWDDLPESIKKKTTDAIERGVNKTSEEWQRKALTIIYNLSLQREYITVDQIWLAGLPKPVGATPKAIGGMLRRAASEGWIIKDTNTGRSQREERNSGYVSVWKSKICPVGVRRERTDPLVEVAAAVSLLREYADDPDAVRMIADELESLTTPAMVSV
jgi:hypothetical protein